MKVAKQLDKSARQWQAQVMDMDTKVLLYINKELASQWGEWADWFFPMITDIHKNIWFSGSFTIYLLFTFWFSFRMKGLGYLLAIIIGLAANDFIAGQIIKPSFARPRPAVAGVPVVLRAPAASDYGFISNHAANSFFLAAMLGTFFVGYRTYFFLWANLIAFSRVYCGVHYPLDVVCGAVYGMLMARLCIKALRILAGEERLYKRRT